jgi:hypothetical protein
MTLVLRLSPILGQIVWKTHAETMLFGEPVVVETRINGAPYYFKAYPSKV